jgi:RNA polymerase sigma-70 factor (ECF subfamily)
LAEAEIAALYRRYYPLIRAKCTRMLADAGDAEDVAQETFIRLWHGELGGRDPRQVTAWIYRTSTRAAIDRLRQRRRQAALHESAAPAGESVFPQSESALAARRALERIARAAPARELEVAVMSRLDAMSQSEIADVLETSERTVRRLLERFDARLAALEKEATA